VVEVLGVTPALEVLRVKALVSVVVEDAVPVTPVLSGVTALVVSGGGGVPVSVPTSGVVVTIAVVSVLVAGTPGVAVGVSGIAVGVSRVAVGVSGVATVSVLEDSGGTTGVEAKVGVDGTAGVSGVGVGVEKTVDIMTVVIGGPP
jgi:hypothetical protein